MKMHVDLHALLVFAQVQASLRQRQALLINLHTNAQIQPFINNIVWTHMRHRASRRRTLAPPPNAFFITNLMY